MLQKDTTCAGIPVHLTSKGTCSSTVVEIKQPRYRDEQQLAQ